MLQQPSQSNMMDACCTCATLLSAVPRFTESEKPLPDDRQLECCSRVICGACIHKNTRFSSYCPYCQQIARAGIPRSGRRPSQLGSPSSGPGPAVLPQGGPLRDPPSYHAAVTASPAAAAAASLVGLGVADLVFPCSEPPPYSPLPAAAAAAAASQPTAAPSSSPPPPSPSDPEKAALAAAAAAAANPNPDYNNNPSPVAEDTLHFLDHEHDTVSSLSLRYGVPADALRRANKLGSDHLLAGRRTILIPGEFYARGVSLSPRPVEGEEEEARKSKIRRWMVTCKVADYAVAVFYLEQAGYDFHDAVDAYYADEAWERDHPFKEDEGGSNSSSGKQPWYVGRLPLSRRGKTKTATPGDPGGSKQHQGRFPKSPS